MSNFKKHLCDIFILKKMSTLIENVSKFGISLIELRDLMELRGHDGVERLTQLGGTLELLKKLHSSEDQGIIGNQINIENRRKMFGSNKIPPHVPMSFMRLIWEALKDLTLIILLVAGLVSLLLSIYEPKDDNS